MSIATDHSDVPAQAFQLHLLKCTCWFRWLLFHAYFSGNIEKTAENGQISFSCFMNLNILLFAKNFTSNCHSSCNFFFFFPSSNEHFRIFSCYITFTDQSLWFLSFKSSPFSKSSFHWGYSKQESEPNAFWQRGCCCMLHPSSTSGGGWQGELQKKRRRALKRTSHMKVTSLQPGKITGPDGKVTASRRHSVSC